METRVSPAVVVVVLVLVAAILLALYYGVVAKAPGTPSEEGVGGVPMPPPELPPDLEAEPPPAEATTAEEQAPTEAAETAEEATAEEQREFEQIMTNLRMNFVRRQAKQG